MVSGLFRESGGHLPCPPFVASQLGQEPGWKSAQEIGVPPGRVTHCTVDAISHLGG